MHLHTTRLTPDPFENTFSGTHLYCGSNNNPIEVEFVAAPKTSIISGFAFRGLCETNCEDYVAALLDSPLWAPDAVHQIPPQVMAKKPLKLFLRLSMLQVIGAAVHVGDREVFPLSSGSTMSVIPQPDMCFKVQL